MKKISAIMCAAVFTALAKVAFANSDFLAYYDFEGVGESAQQYISDCETIESWTTNHGLKSYDFYSYNDSVRLRFVGFTNSEESQNGDRFFDFKFDEYTPEKYPDTKLVIGYDEINEYNNKDSYQRTVIQNAANKKMLQMYVVKNTEKDQYYYRPNNATPYKTLNAGVLNEFRYVIDLESGTFETLVNGVSKNVRNSLATGLNSLSRITWNPTKEEIFSIDNIYAVAVPNEFGIVSINDNIDVDGGILNVKLTAPVDEASIDKIKVYDKNEDQIEANVRTDFKNSGIIITFPDKLRYNSEYTLRLETGFKDIAGNPLEEDIVFKTRAAYAYENDNVLAYYDFEGVGVSASQFFVNNDNVSTKTTNHGIKSYEFYNYGDSTRLRFTGFMNSEQSSNSANRSFDFKFDEYTLEKYPDTKLVIGYDEINEYNNKDSYQRTVIQNAANKKMLQMYVVKSTKESQYYYRPNNASPYKTLNTGVLNEFRYVIDLESGTFEPFVNGASKNVRNSLATGLSSLSRITWDCIKEEIFSIDNIYAVAVPNNPDVVGTNDYVDTDGGVLNVKLTAPADKDTIDKIKVYDKNGTQIAANVRTDLKNSSIKVSFPNKLEYDSEYTLKFESGFKDIAGNTLIKEIKFNTERSYSFNINVVTNDYSNDLQYEVSAENLSNAYVDAHIVIALYDESGNLVKCSYLRQNFAPNKIENISGIFKNAAGYTVRAFADDI